MPIYSDFNFSDQVRNLLGAIRMEREANDLRLQQAEQNPKPTGLQRQDFNRYDSKLDNAESQLANLAMFLQRYE